MSDEKLKHLEFIQNIITRMNTNSFQIKGWAVTIVAALLAIYASAKHDYLLLAGVFPTTIFWFLDAYYLSQERKFRGLYNDVAGVSKEPKDIKLFAMRPDLYSGGTFAYGDSFWSSTICSLYLAMNVALVGLFILFKLVL